MIEKSCDIWAEAADFRCIPTTGAVNDDGTAVLKSPVSVQAARKFSGLALDLGRLISSRGNHVHEIRPGILSFPVQQYAWSGPTIQVIQRSAAELAALVGERKALLPRPGCDAGELAWENVAAALASLPDNVVVVTHTG